MLSDAVKYLPELYTLSLPASHTIGIDKLLPPTYVIVCYLYAPGYLEGGGYQATDPIWSLTTSKDINKIL